jgi:2-succinyl-6-hydroxy-2,4-cyclohexadiene-1-carboxylate synthase
MSTVSLRDGLRLHVEEAGKGVPVLLLHGFTGCARAWGEPVLGALSERARMVAVDLLGHGGSDAPSTPHRYALPEIVEDLCQVLDTRGMERAVWLGYSMGGRIALGAAVLRPERLSALVLESASPGLAEESARRERTASDEALARKIEAEGIHSFVEGWMRQPLFRTQSRLEPRRFEPLRELRLRNSPEGLAACLRGLGTGVQPSFWDELSDVGPPALLVAGELDEKFRQIAEVMHERLPRAELRVIPDAGHTTHLERTAEFVSAVLGFLEKIDA